MFAELLDDSKVGRNFAVAISPYINRPIFEYELAIYDRERLLKTVADNNKRQALSADYKKLDAIKQSTRYSYLIWWLMRVLCFISINKALIYIYATHFQYESFPRVAGLSVDTRKSADTTTYSYHCLKSNCSSLFGSHLETSRREQTLAKLPAFFVCHQILTNFMYALDGA
jgi:hypothetical protein